MKVNYIIIEKLSNICENYTWGPPSANQGISTDSHNSQHVQVTLHANNARIGPPSTNQGISTDSHNSHHVQVTLWVTPPTFLQGESSVF